MAAIAKIESGMFNKRIAIQDFTKVSDGQGGFTRSWSNLPGCDRVPARITHRPIPTKGDEQFKQHQVQASHIYEIEIRYRPSQNIAPRMRIIYKNKTLEIRSVSVPDETSTSIVLYAEELASSGSL